MLDKSGTAKTSAAQHAAPRLDLQQHLADLEAAGLLTRIDRPINKDTELGPLVRWQFIGGVPEEQRRAFLFTNVVDSSGKKYDMPVVVGALSANPEIYGIGMGKPVEQIGQAWIDAVNHPIKPVRITAPAPCQEVVIKGDDLKKADGGLKLLPVPISTPGFDAAPYFTATLCVTKDPESGVQNMGTYRAGLKATDRLGVRMASRIGGAGGYQHWLKHRKLKTPLPIAIVNGCAPVVAFTGPQKLAIDMDEMGVAGALAGEPIRTVKCVTVDLEVPADAELVIEGLIDPELLEPEGPFGDWTGTYTESGRKRPLCEITAIYYRNDPILLGFVPQSLPDEYSRYRAITRSALLKQNIEAAGVPDVKAVWAHECGGSRLLYGVAINQRFDGHAVQAGHIACQCHVGAYGSRWVIVVDDDIDVSNLEELMWAALTRADPVKDIDFIRGAWNSPADPRIEPAERAKGNLFDLENFVERELNVADGKDATAPPAAGGNL